jgi:hypothetical protein
MNDAELCGRVVRVAFARPQRFKEGHSKPIWMQEDYYKKERGLLEERQKEKDNVKKEFS